MKEQALEKVETKEELPTKEENGFDLSNLIKSAGTLILNKEQKDILFSPPKDDDVEIREDGLVYLPWMEYMTRLNKAFGTEWAIIPQGMPRKENNLLLWGFYLIIQGKYCGFAIGEQTYHPNNPTMSWGDAVEGAKSNALMRLSKGLGITIELWKPSFVRNWKEKYATSYIDKGKKKWKRKGQANNKPKETEPKETKAEDTTKPIEEVKKLYGKLSKKDREDFNQLFPMPYEDMNVDELRSAYRLIKNKIYSDFFKVEELG